MDSTNNRRRSPRGAAVGALAAFAFAAGCGPDGLAYAPVSGVVLLDGAPLEKAQVSLTREAGPDGRPIAGRTSVATGTTDAQGRFALTSLTPENTTVDGVAVGKHRVSIYAEIREPAGGYGEDKIIRKELLPPRYNRQSELTCEVPPGGTDACNFQLSKK